jgi:hypothetical protein
MTKGMYRSANGKTVDMGKLVLQNEQVRAVGNMKVNARGDQIDDNNNIIRNKNQQVSQQYQQQVKPQGNND